jgi:putative FmdB family regulatory protein
MPTYEYECPHCGHRFEALQKITAKPLDKCPKCNKKVKKLISTGVGIIFKGSGFYATDYRKKTKTEPLETKAKDNVCPKMKEGCNACKQE